MTPREIRLRLRLGICRAVRLEIESDLSGGEHFTKDSPEAGGLDAHNPAHRIDLSDTIDIERSELERIRDQLDQRTAELVFAIDCDNCDVSLHCFVGDSPCRRSSPPSSSTSGVLGKDALARGKQTR